MQQQKEIIEQILNQLEQDSTITTKDQLYKITNEILKISGAPISPPLFQILAGYRERLVTQSKKSDPRIAKLLRKRAVRSLSGVSVISLLTKFWGCPGKCVYCPTFDTLPKSYVPSEPAVMRAEHNDFDTVRQIQNRLRSLEITGHIVEKCDIRVIGGTWSVYPVEYQEAVMRDIYDAHTTYAELAPHIEAVESGDRLAGFRVKKGYQMRASETLLEAQKRNESAASRVIGIAIETRPDWITPEEIARLRNYGVTRVEIGYQTTDDHVNAVNRRGHGNTESMRATQLLKDAGFKVVAHMMPNLLESTPEIDRASMREVFDNPGYAPDELKIYPMVVTDKSELTEIWRNGGFTPYPDDLLIDLMADLESYLPLWVRLNRSYRDIPAEQILSGSKLSNLRELTETTMRHKWLVRHDISAREIRARGNSPESAIERVTQYPASDGIEYFIEYIDPVDTTLFALARLRIPSQYFTGETPVMPILENTALIREVHVFGDQLSIGAMADGSGQHMGFGRRLIERAENIVREWYPTLTQIAVIAGVWVRPYFTKNGYTLKETYMVKALAKY